MPLPTYSLTLQGKSCMHAHEWPADCLHQSADILQRIRLWSLPLTPYSHSMHPCQAHACTAYDSVCWLLMLYYISIEVLDLILSLWQQVIGSERTTQQTTSVTELHPSHQVTPTTLIMYVDLPTLTHRLTSYSTCSNVCSLVSILLLPIHLHLFHISLIIVWLLLLYVPTWHLCMNDSSFFPMGLNVLFYLIIEFLFLLWVSALHYLAGSQVLEGFWTVASACVLCQRTVVGLSISIINVHKFRT